MKLHPPVKHLLVDLDGTLLGNRNLPLSLDFLREVFAILRKHGGFRQTARLLLAVQDEFRRPSAQLTNDLRALGVFAKKLNMPIEEARTFIRESLFAIFPKLGRHFYPIEGAQEFLEWAKDIFPLTLATNPVWPSEIIDMRIRWAGLDPAMFGRITHARTMHACKPTREYYEEILSQQGLKPEDCLLIGNDMKMDLPATVTGIRVFIVGPFNKIKPLTYQGAKAPAWRGSYTSLRRVLEQALPQNSQTLA